jgi:transposase
MPATAFASTSGTEEHARWDRGARPAIPAKQNEAPVACPEWAYNNRNQVERLWARLKAWRAIATRYEKTAQSFRGVLCLAAALNWIRR